MDLELSAEQEDLVRAVHDFLAAKRPIHALREELSAEQSDAHWRETADLGWLSISLSEEDGGVGYSFVDEALVFEQLGRQLVTGPFISTVIAIRLAALAGATDLVGALAGGSSRAGLALARELVARDGDRITGSFTVVDGLGADHLLVWTPAVKALVLATDLEQHPAQCLDEAVSLSDVTLDRHPTLIVADDRQSHDLEIRASVLSAAVLSGIAASTSEMSVEFAKTRTQFGKPIGTFQAVSRRCADMAIRAWSASSLVRVAALCVDDGRADAAYQAAAAKMIAGQAAEVNGADTIQNHGAIGWTAEHDAHHFVKRGRLIDTAWGDSRRQVPILLDEHPRAIGLGGEPPVLRVNQQA